MSPYTARPMPLPLFLAALAILSIATGGCSSPQPADPLAPRAVHELGRWTVAQDGAELGSVVLLEIEDPIEPMRMYRVENAVGQWLGYVDAQGRVFQRVPFEEREVFRGIHPMNEGIALLFDRPAAVDLLPAGEATATEAAHRQN